jgi:hypothetical protein
MPFFEMADSTNTDNGRTDTDGTFIHIWKKQIIQQQ